MYQPKTQHVALQGTVDLVTPPIAKSPSHAITADNVQPLWGGGFGRIEGYEPVDGGSAPSDYIYYRVIVDHAVDPSWVNGTFKIETNAGKTYNGFISAVDVDTNSFRVVSVELDGVQGETAIITLPSSGEVRTTLQYLVTFGFGDTAEDQAKFLAESHDIIFKKITKPVGDGLLLGVVDLDGQLIAMRDNGGTLAISKANADRTWTLAPNVYEVTLKGVTTPGAFQDGVTIDVGGTQALLYAASFSADGQTGAMYINTNIPSTADINISIGGTVVAKTAGSTTKAQYTSGHSWTFIYNNFYAGSGTRYAYGTNGHEVVEVRPNGVVIPVPIKDSRNITAIEIHRNHLFVAFTGGQYGHCAVGEPLNWEVLLGAEQFGTGDEITSLQSMPGGYLLIGCKNSLHLLAGKTRSDWVASRLSSVGITAGTLTSTFKPIAHSTNGFIDVSQTQAFGDFIANEIAANSLLGEGAFNPNSTKFFAHSHKNKHNQIRFYQQGISRHLVIQLLPDGSNRATYFSYPKALEGVWDTKEHTYLAFDDGHVYRQSDEVCSFAGDDIYWVLRLAYTHAGSPTIVKSWESFELQMSSEGSLNVSFNHSLDYGSAEHALSVSSFKGVFGGGGRWDESFWDSFFWSSPDYVTPNVYLNGHSKNISILLSGRSNFEKNFKLDGYTLSYIPRRRYRV